VHLKQLSLRGFKTFADATKLDFAPGITAIVGPNGVGKSNLVDALVWVLGEQSPRALRAANLQEIIFAGTEARRPLGMAEVTVILDNADHWLPTEYTEVAITRRLFRNGQSEYLLNRTPCRAREVRDLLLDTGLGPAAYAVIGQGEVEAILSVRPEDRRELLEEAAGVRRYRVRRDEAQRRLEQAGLELRRLQDLLAELSRQLSELETEAARAREYQALDEQLRALEMGLLASEYRGHRSRLGRLEHSRAVAEQQLQEARSQAAALEEELACLRQEAERAQARLEELQPASVEMERRLQELRRRRDVAHQRAEGLRAQLDTLRQAEAEARARHESLAARCQTLAEEVRLVAKEVEVARAACQTAAEQVRHLQAAYEEQEQRRRARQQRAATLSEQRARVQEEISGLQLLAEELAERRRRVEAQMEETRGLCAELAARREAIAAQLARWRAEAPTLEKELGQAREATACAEQALAEHLSKLQVLRQRLAATEAVLQTLTDLARRRAELGAAPAAVLQAAERGQLRDVLGSVGELLQVPAGLEEAVASVLGERLQWVVVRNRQAAEAAAALVRQRQLGRLGLLVLEELPGPGPAAPRLRGPLVVGWGPELVKSDPALAPLVAYLLGEVVVVRDWDAAQRLRQAVPPGALLVTLTGEVLSAGGEQYLVGGPLDQQSPLLARRRQQRLLAERRERILAAEAQLVAGEAWLRNQATAARRKREELESRLSQTRQQALEAEAELNALGERLAAAEAALQEWGDDLRLLEQRLQHTRHRLAVAEQAAARLEEELQALQSQSGLGEDGAVAERLARAQEAAVAAQIRLAQLEQRLRASQAEFAEARQERSRVEERWAQLQRRQEPLATALAEVEKELAALPEVEAWEQRLAAVQAAQRAEKERWQECRRQESESEARLQQLRRQAEEAAERMHRAELGVAREEAHLAALAERLQDQFGLTPAEAEARCAQDFPRGAAAAEAERLKQRIRALGPVNLGAPQELERLRARHDYLLAQQEDIEAGRQRLTALIEELDQAAQAEFRRAFEEVGQAFADCFQRLFAGGEARLELTNPADPLGGGVEIMVRPPGKRWQNMLLLSGGEKALTATAFIFALLQVRPAPFCVLDEVDAALDAASTERFLTLLREFAARSQFLIVTHNPQTIATAQRIYGVTMQTPGVSLVVAVELEEAQELARDGSRMRWRAALAT
jgi:chromosome segregation protein